MRVAIGLMSGTSADGIDAVAADVSGRGDGMRARLRAHVHVPYPAALRRAVLAVMAPARTRTEDLCRLDVQLGERFADAVVRLMRAARLRPANVAVIGSHGQTVCHLPRAAATLQLGRAAVIAARAGVPVVSDFRSADVAVGGGGAPLVPWTDWMLLRSDRCDRIVQNIGGIANLTWLPAGGGPRDVIAFDTGPGNMVMDELVRLATRGRRAYDRNGRMAARGVVSRALLEAWLRHPFLRRRPPRCCGREEFGREFVARARRRFASHRLDWSDWLATATMLTVETIAQSVERWLPPNRRRAVPRELVLCGGGARNLTLRAWLADRLPAVAVRTIDEFGIDAGAKEALSFALLACAHVDGVPANLPQVTGARRPVVLGQLSPATALGARA